MSALDSLETIHIQIPEKTFNGAEIPNKLEEIPTKYDKEGRPVEPRPSDDPKDPLNFSNQKKYTILALVAFVGLLGFFSASIYVPAILDVVKGLDANLTIINATVSIYVLFLGIAPLIWAPLSELMGRRWVYLLSTTIYVIATVLCGISPNVWMFFVMRILQAIGASAAQSVGAGSITDLFFVHERGMALGIFFMGPLVGTVVGPIVGGYINQYLNWRWIFYIMAIIGGVIVIATYFFLPETAFQRAKPDSLNPVDQITAVSSPPKRRMGNPLRALVLLSSPDVFLASLYVSITFSLMNLLITIIPELFIRIYGFSTGSVGLVFLAGGLGNLMGSLIGGRYSDIILRRLTLANGGVRVPEMRLTAMLPSLLLVPGGFLLYGWSLKFGLHWMVPLVGSFLSSIGLMLIMTSVNTYLVDGYHQYSAFVIGAANFLRAIFSSCTPLFAVPMEAALGPGWTFTVCAILCFSGYAIILVVYRWGEGWRARTTTRFAKK